ncbi:MULTISPECIES: ester cyclase [Streptomyces]|uniref:Nuclear transport factor 2 family protein n=1 Tax=Streptomyces fuscus TaxID=3048495 RepID=A0ABT7J994_9ACTN|nr:MULTISPECIES: nuclear transport factor 2 family protein [Streptomyces]MCM1976910.1 ester cyclase [Streptomyces sp. G1]MDL2081451.1 nuclear transport factor 2 family protein [Streptomyces fuscus]WBO79602.1 ester cyclase [Streptomyces sp. SBE_14.2]SBT88511.1 Ketosteroid isomerase-related protein [Streptomyces sp. DI166]
MGQAREVMDRLTAAVTGEPDLKALAELFAEDAVAVTPDEGEVTGRDHIVEYFRQMTDAVPNAVFEPLNEYEAGDTAIDEGFFSGINSGPIALPDGQSLPATGKPVKLRGVDFATVRDGRIVSYRLYFDQMEFLGQLGLLPED